MIRGKSYNLWFDGNSGRFMLGEYGLHCGDCFQAFIRGEWVEVRIEHCQAGWYLVGAQQIELQGLTARML